MALHSLRAALRTVSSTVLYESISSQSSILSKMKSFIPNIAVASLHSSPIRRGLNEFFETEKNRGATKVWVGRSWRQDELRQKSNEDLHKLWYILLKERNMLLTMEHAYKEEYVAMPNQERIDKVEESMENLEEVVRERNKAFHQLEVGISGEREREYRTDWTGRIVPYKPEEHELPIRMNDEYRRKLRFNFHKTGGEDVLDFQRRYRERLHNRDLSSHLKEMRKAARVVRRFPDASMSALVEQFPLIDPDKLLRWKKIKGYSKTQHDV